MFNIKSLESVVCQINFKTTVGMAHQTQPSISQIHNSLNKLKDRSTTHCTKQIKYKQTD